MIERHMIIKQTTTITFQYPQDYHQEREWLNGKDDNDKWVHKGLDTLCSIYEHEISYIIGQTEREG